MAKKVTTGISEIDTLIGGVRAGDNIVWEIDSGAPTDVFVFQFLSACSEAKQPVFYTSFNHSPQTIASRYADQMSGGGTFTLIDCFSSGKGNSDEMFLQFHKNETDDKNFRAIHVENPSDPTTLQEQLAPIADREGREARYVFDSLTGMFDLWGNEDDVLRFFGHICPRLYNLDTVAYWTLEKEAHTNPFLAKVRHITQVVIEISVSEGTRMLAVRKASNRQCDHIGVSQQFSVVDDRLAVATQSREDRELNLLTSMGEAIETALDPQSFFERTMGILCNELGMMRGTLVLLDKAAGKLKIVAAQGLSPAERARGEYAVGEGITGQVVQTGLPSVVPDIAKDGRFLDRTAARKTDLAQHPVAFICVPLKVGGEVLGVLSVDRPFAVESTLEKDQRLLAIVASIVSQVLKINRLIHVDKGEIIARDEKALHDLRFRYRLDNVIGQSEATRKVLATAATAADSSASILISGETGTGKELIANVIHYNSPRSEGPFVKVNCGALTETLLESELFGHVKGAFTGAVHDRKGRFQLANDGTLFLDEVSEMSPHLQVKLLRILQEGEFEPVGGMKTIRVNVRVVAATNKTLKTEIQEGRFREDLYYRLNVIPIQMPPLRERRDDIPLLVDHFLEKYNKFNNKNVTKLSREVLDLLLAYSWPGNVRELENCIERSVVMSPGTNLSIDLLPEEVTESKTAGPAALQHGNPVETIRTAVEQACDSAVDIAETMATLRRTVEGTIIKRLLERGVSQRELSVRLGMSRMTLRKRISEYGLL